MKRLMVLVMLYTFSSHVSSAGERSVGPNGINSAGLPLDGTGVAIGMVEIERVGLISSPGNVRDDAVHTHDDVVAVKAFRQGKDVEDAPTNFNQDVMFDHTHQVAGVMVSKDNQVPGVAPEASLYSAAVVTPGNLAADYDGAILATQAVASQTNMRAVNHSWGKEFISGDILDGNNKLTLALDWSAREHDVLHVVAGNQPGAFPAPKANFNGITVGSSRIRTTGGSLTGKYDTADTDNVISDLLGDREALDILAPGEDIRSTRRDDLFTTTVPNSSPVDDGTSFAAPHVTGTIALMHEHIATEINNSAPRFSASGHRHEVIKAAILNSADKLADDGSHSFNGNPIAQGSLLGMDRTVYMQNGTSTWLDSFAFDNFPFDTGVTFFEEGFFPQDPELGLGHLNAERAIQQIVPGEYDGGVGNPVAPIGWDLGMTTGAGISNRYPINQQLAAGDFISITLAWDKVVELVDSNTNGTFESGEVFEQHTSDEFNNADDKINDLDLFLVPSGSPVNQAVAMSQSLDSTLEHIFLPVLTTGNYDIVVVQEDDDIPGGQDYGLAWWYGIAPDIGGNLSSDFNNDGDVDGADLSQWQGDYGINGDSDANGDGDSDGLDFLAWQREAVVTAGASPLPPSPPPVEPDPIPVPTATVSFDAKSRSLSRYELKDAGGALSPTDEVHDFFISSDADILAIVATNLETTDGEIFQSEFGSDTALANPELVEQFPSLGADSFITTPGATSTIGGNMSDIGEHAEVVWFDFSQDEAVEDFLFAQFTTEGGLFEGYVAVVGDDGPEYFLFSFSFGAFKSLVSVPEPGTWVLGVMLCSACAGGRLPRSGSR